MVGEDGALKELIAGTKISSRIGGVIGGSFLRRIGPFPKPGNWAISSVEYAYTDASAACYPLHYDLLHIDFLSFRCRFRILQFPCPLFASDLYEYPISG